MFVIMGRKMNDKELSICKRIDEILWDDWDPIGVHEMPEKNINRIFIDCMN
jgi:hypothetical protein